MAIRYKFRLGDYQSITLSCEPLYGTELRCRARGRIGRVHWATQFYASDDQIKSFLASINLLIGDLRGVAELRVPDGGGFGGLILTVSVEPRGTIATTYEATGPSGGLRRSQWRASGSYVCYHQHYFTSYGQHPRE